MKKEELAATLNGREIGEETDWQGAEEAAAKQSGLLVIFGASDDLCELRGAINDEVGAYNGTTLYVHRDGTLAADFEDGDEDVLQRHGLLAHAKDRLVQSVNIHAMWCAEKGGPAWTYKTDEPHATFDIMEDGEVWCRGIVIQLGASS